MGCPMNTIFKTAAAIATLAGAHCEGAPVAAPFDLGALRAFHATLTAAAAARIRTESVEWAIGEASREEIDDLNILQATLLAMRRAFAGLRRVPARVEVATAIGTPRAVKVSSKSEMPGLAASLTNWTNQRLDFEFDVNRYQS